MHVSQSAVDAIVVIDAQGRIEVFNPAAERLFGYAEAEVIGRNVSMLMPAPYRDEHDGYLKRYLDEGNARVIGIGREVEGLKRDGTMFPLHLSVGEMLVEGQRKFTAWYIKDGNVAAALTVGRSEDLVSAGHLLIEGTDLSGKRAFIEDESTDLTELH